MLYLNFSVKKSKKAKTAIIITALAIAAAIIFCAASACGKSKIPDTAERAGAGENSLKVSDEAGARSFLKGFNIEEVLEKTGEEKIIIPQKFNAVYEKYNGLQKQIGLDLTRFKGKSALKTTYRIKSERAEYAVLLTRSGRVIGGHLTSLRYGRGNLPLG